MNDLQCLEAGCDSLVVSPLLARQSNLDPGGRHRPLHIADGVRVVVEDGRREDRGSARTDRNALFTIQPNEVDSSILRWEFTTPLPAREHGMISFQVRVR